jgi:NAD(P)-dependent dehydrogenase (short-subunit alcohol dehydrogenase family)
MKASISWIAITAAFPAFAQTPENQETSAAEQVNRADSSDAIIVTAQRREQDLQSTALAIEAASADSLARAGVTNADQLTTQFSGVQFGVWLCMRAEIREMVCAGKGSIVNTSSDAGLTAVPGSGSYSAAKHGVIGLTKTAAVEYAERGIRVNAICPGLTRSGITQRLIETAPELIESVLPPMKRMAEPDEIAGAVVFLLSDAASYLSGQAIAIDGAATAI